MKTLSAALLAVAIGALAPRAWAMPATNLAAVIDLQDRAKRQAVVYAEVRAAVEAGRRPAADLDAARRELKAAQAAMYDQIDTAREDAAARLRALGRRNERHLRKAEADVAEAEAALAAAGPDERPVAEARLRLTRDLVDGYRREAGYYATPPARTARPRLPILPPADPAAARVAARARWVLMEPSKP